MTLEEDGVIFALNTAEEEELWISKRPSEAIPRKHAVSYCVNTFVLNVCFDSKSHTY